MEPKTTQLQKVTSLAEAARVVRDIHWAVASPPLLTPAADQRFPSGQWFLEQAEELQAALIKLANQPEQIQVLTSLSKTLRLGGYFEQLILWWLNHSERYEVLAHNLQVNYQGRTLGAFDLIIHDRKTQMNEHWELACKFYLQDGDGSQIQSWFGPGRKDKLELKYRHLLEHQIALSEHPAGRALLQQRGWEVQAQRIVVKGRLFGDQAALPPVVNPDCLSGSLHTSQAPLAEANAQQSNGAQILALQRQHWMSTAFANDAIEHSPTTASRNGCICFARLENGIETKRGFIVPNNWALHS